MDERDERQSTALLLAAQNGYVDVARLLLDRNASVDVRDDKQCTPLMLAAQNGYFTVTRQLLDRNANTEARDFVGRTPLAFCGSRKSLPNCKVVVGSKREY